MNLYYFKKDFLDLLELDNTIKYDTLSIINKMFEFKLIKKIQMGTTNIPSRKIRITKSFREELNRISTEINPKLKLLYNKKCTISLIYNFLWRFTINRNIKEIPNIISEDDFKFPKLLII